MKPIPMPARLLAAVLLSVPATQGMAATLRLNQFDAWTRADADGNGGLTREEAHRMPRLARHFDAIDGNGDGVITGAEVRAWRQATRRSQRAAKELAGSKGLDEILRIADGDGDGALSRAEFSQGLPRFARRFERLDLDHDASLSRAELGLWLARLRGARRSKQP